MKKLIALGLSIALMASMATVVFGNNARSNAGIEFTGGFGPPIVIDPSNPPVNPPVDPPFWNQFDSMNLDFGVQYVSLLDEEYDSVEPMGVGIISNETWNLAVRIGGFVNQGDGRETLQGFTMDLNEDFSEAYGSPGASWIEVWGVSGLSVDSGALTLASGLRGIYGINLDGILYVLGNTAQQGRAQAELTWTFVAGAD